MSASPDGLGPAIADAAKARGYPEVEVAVFKSPAVFGYRIAVDFRDGRPILQEDVTAGGGCAAYERLIDRLFPLKAPSEPDTKYAFWLGSAA